MSIPSRFDAITVWKNGDQRAPHKPLLILYALGRWQQGKTKPIPFHEVEKDLTELLKEFGPIRQRNHPEYPFWRLQNDKVWLVESDGPMATRKSKDEPKKSELLKKNARGCFLEDVQGYLRKRPEAIGELATSILEANFPESLHSDILNAVGLCLEPAKGRKRDPRFRNKVLTAYEYRCAVCGFDVRIGSVSIALDAAHIRWHQAGGPESEDNGLALCVMHHKAFDLGVFGLQTDGMILVSDLINGTYGKKEWLMIHHGKKIRAPQRPEWAPHHDFIEWHRNEVFKGRARHLE